MFSSNLKIRVVEWRRQEVYEKVMVIGEVLSICIGLMEVYFYFFLLNKSISK